MIDGRLREVNDRVHIKAGVWNVKFLGIRAGASGQIKRSIIEIIELIGGVGRGGQSLELARYKVNAFDAGIALGHGRSHHASGGGGRHGVGVGNQLDEIRGIGGDLRRSDRKWKVAVARSDRDHVARCATVAPYAKVVVKIRGLRRVAIDDVTHDGLHAGRNIHRVSGIEGPGESLGSRNRGTIHNHTQSRRIGCDGDLAGRRAVEALDAFDVRRGIPHEI